MQDEDERGRDCWVREGERGRDCWLGEDEGGRDLLKIRIRGFSRILALGRSRYPPNPTTCHGREGLK